jgi:hypothetical protein
MRGVGFDCVAIIVSARVFQQPARSTTLRGEFRYTRDSGDVLPCTLTSKVYANTISMPRSDSAQIYLALSLSFFASVDRKDYDGVDLKGPIPESRLSFTGTGAQFSVEERTSRAVRIEGALGSSGADRLAQQPDYGEDRDHPAICSILALASAEIAAAEERCSGDDKAYDRKRNQGRVGEEGGKPQPRTASPI